MTVSTTPTTFPVALKAEHLILVITSMLHELGIVSEHAKRNPYASFSVSGRWESPYEVLDISKRGNLLIIAILRKIVASNHLLH